jgi:hypothetical protein
MMTDEQGARLTADELAAIQRGSRALGQFRPDRDREFLDALIWRGTQIDRLLDHIDALTAENERLQAALEKVPYQTAALFAAGRTDGEA